MNKRYIDFVPTKKTARGAEVKTSTPVKTNRVSKPSVKPTPVVRRAVVSRTKTNVEAARPSSEKTEIRTPKQNNVGRQPGVVKQVTTRPVLGVVEDLNQSFTNTEVPKRPLGQNDLNSGKVLAETKARKVGNAATAVKRGAVEKPVEKTVKPKVNSTFKPPVAAFINQEKVVKRPLSKNVYPKQPVKASTPSETKVKAPVTIIAKPEKDANVSIVVTIIITIILGAAAGTVAFLLLPK